jgi:hypothetical protein
MCRCALAASAKDADLRKTGRLRKGASSEWRTNAPSNRRHDGLTRLLAAGSSGAESSERDGESWRRSGGDGPRRRARSR